MARFNPNRAPAGKKIVEQLPALLAACRNGNAFDIAAMETAANTAQFFSAVDPTENTRSEVRAGARVMQAHISHGAKFITALDTYAESMLAWHDSDYERAKELAVEAVAIASRTIPRKTA